MLKCYLKSLNTRGEWRGEILRRLNVIYKISEKVIVGTKKSNSAWNQAWQISNDLLEIPTLFSNNLTRLKVFNEAFPVTTNIFQTSSKTSWIDTVVSQHLNFQHHYQFLESTNQHQLSVLPMEFANKLSNTKKECSTNK